MSKGEGGAREQAGRKGGGEREREDTTKRGALAAPQHRARKGKEEVKMGGGIAEGRLKIDRGAED